MAGKHGLFFLTAMIAAAKKRCELPLKPRSDTMIYSILFKDDEDRPFGGGGMGGHHGGMGGRRGRYPQEERVEGKKILEQNV